MKKFLILGVVLVLTASAPATIVDNYYSGTINAAIPDANPTGLSFSHTTTTANANPINGVNVRLNLSGGFNGDLYGYLVFQSVDNTTVLTAMLLNRVGRTGASDAGFATAGMNVVLTSGAAQNIHDVTSPASTYGTPGTYYNADSRTTSPNSAFSPGLTTGSGLSVFDNASVNGNGTWTLFLADLSGGDVSTLVAWGLDISVVPEPTTWALLGFAALVTGGGLRSAWRRRQKA